MRVPGLGQPKSSRDHQSETLRTSRQHSAARPRLAPERWSHMEIETHTEFLAEKATAIRQLARNVARRNRATPHRGKSTVRAWALAVMDQNTIRFERMDGAQSHAGLRIGGIGEI